MKIIDCRELACPGPVIQTKKALEDLQPGESIAVDVNSQTSRENVRRFAQTRGSVVKVEDTGDDVYRIVITAAKENVGEAPASPPVVFIASDTLGSGNGRLGKILMEGYVNTLAEQDKVPDSILLMNTGVKLAVEGSVVLDTLKTLTDRGCEIKVCGTCLEFFGLKEKLAVGMVSNMYDIQSTLLEASSVIRL